MRRNRVLIVLALAILSGCIAGYSALRFMQERPTPLVASEPRSTQPVVVAARDLALGDVVSEEDVRMVEWPGDVIPEGYASTVPEVLGRGVLTSVTMNEPDFSSRRPKTPGRRQAAVSEATAPRLSLIRALPAAAGSSVRS